MSSVPNQFSVPVAVQGHSTQDLTSHVVMTHDFGVLNPIMCRVMFPGDQFEVKPEFFTYLDPLPCPTFGDVKMITRAFFVPFRVLHSQWKDFIDNNKVVQSIYTSTPANIPFTVVSEFSAALFGNTTSVNQLINLSGHRRDIRVTRLSRNGDSFSTTDEYYELTYVGRQYLSVLHGLGYNFPYVIVDPSITEDSIISAEDDVLLNLFHYGSQKLSLLPWIAFWRFYIDWIVPSRFIPQHNDILLGLRAFHDNYNPGGYFATSIFGKQDGSVALRDFLYLFTTLPSVYLPDDFFTSAFAHPYGYESTPATGTVIPDVGSDNITTFPDVKVDGAYSAGAHATIEDGDNISMFTLRSLGALQDMINRGKVAGTKIQDYLRVTYGVEPGSAALDISTYLGSHSDDIKIGSVSSNADTFVETTGDGAYLGQYAGRGLGSSTQIGTFKYETKEHGLFFVTCELVAKSSYWQGLRPECTMIDRLDFFQPEFDALGVEAIPQSLLNNGVSLYMNEYPNEEISPNEVFGFTSTYSKYKVSFDSLLGDFRVGGLNTGMDSWYLARYFTSPEYIDNNFARMVQDNTSLEYDHIFQNADNSSDHFKTKWILHVRAQRPMKSLEDVLEFEDNSGKEVKSSFNGSVNS